MATALSMAAMAFLITIVLGYPSNIPNLPGHNWANSIAMATPLAHKGLIAGAKAQANFVGAAARTAAHHHGQHADGGHTQRHHKHRLETVDPWPGLVVSSDRRRPSLPHHRYAG